ncbi:PaaX family transcriptional regulator [Leekyejoonella antrihumi]|uniref:PaaX family transcriptional regulator n=1 Tax=Leekyejoonella antrihumi TaxID=1660198 RepID=A0A563DU00_9MICO|nr:PaaX family transcriptional regulator C-terminal domain-containing protein [Leekyejoonella antrihumi]TWP33727.1 PaaX family transcriptional regulator [Leekyejoonella antrihumi]
MHARSAVFDLYGDHLADRGGWAPISAVVRLVGKVEVAPAATRTAVSRMVREGWLEPQERAGVRGYAATARATARLASAWQRIYAVVPPPWDGRWHLVATDHVPDRSRRARLAASLGYLGYARLSSGTWIAPRASSELASALDGTPAHEFFSSFIGDGHELATSVWDLATLDTSYRDFLRWVGQTSAGAGPRDPAQAYTTRTMVVHEWRKFLFSDPGLPAQVLPSDWPGTDAARTFTSLTSRLRPAAAAYVDDCLRESGVPVPAPS